MNGSTINSSENYNIGGEGVQPSKTALPVLYAGFGEEGRERRIRKRPGRAVEIFPIIQPINAFFHR
jgi:hypothetical protein